MTARVHRSHDRPRLEAPRARELRPLPRDAAGEPVGAHKRPCRALVRSLFAEARKAVSEQGVGDAAVVARTALQLYRAGRRELGAGGPSAIAALWSWALLTACAHSLTLAAARESLTSDRGLELFDRAQKAQGRAERSWTAAAAACGLLRGHPAERGNKRLNPLHAAILNAGGIDNDSDAGEPGAKGEQP